MAKPFRIGNHVLAMLASGMAVQPAQPPSASVRPAQAWWSHVAFLAGDELLGREPGSAGDRKAADYIAAIFERARLKPGGTRGYFQDIRFRSRRIVEERSSLFLIRNGTSEPLALGDDAAFNMRIEPAADVEAPIVFVGYGLTVPEMHYDDLAGLDLHGKIVLLLTGGPSTVPGLLRAHYEAQRWPSLRNAGAIGVLQIQNPKGTDIPWERSMLRRFMPQLTPEDPRLDETAGQQLAITINPARAETFFVGSGHTFAEVLALAAAEKPLPTFPLPISVRASVRTETSDLESRNVIGILPGTDPKLKSEYVVLSAHFDHLGVGSPINGDSIYNGAMDNSSGVATLLEAALALARTKEPPRRSVLFIAVTAEEKGLLGSRYFAAHPTIPAAQMVAAVNVDMPLPLFPLRRLMAQGLEESDLAIDLRSVAARLGIEVASDPEPERNSFTRSDQYSFVKRGVPAIALKVGFGKDTPEHEIVMRWRSERYHAPSDDLRQPIDFQAAADFNRAYLLVVEAIANRTERPRWNNDSFFRRFAP
jgi:Zn-dependent M28 family amino/carboxypeptidase